MVPGEETAARSDAPTREQAEEVYAAYLGILAVARDDEFLGHRLALAGTTLEIVFQDAPGERMAIGILLDRAPIDFVEGGLADAEVRLFARTRDVHLFWSGELHLAMAIADGRITYEGPVRKVLRIVPIALRLVESYSARMESGMLNGHGGGGT